MGKRIFEVTITRVINLELDDAVIDAVNDEWRTVFYDLHEPEEIAAMIGRCMVLFRSDLDDLDGWGDQPKENASFSDVDDDVEAQEIT